MQAAAVWVCLCSVTQKNVRGCGYPSAVTVGISTFFLNYSENRIFRNSCKPSLYTRKAPRFRGFLCGQMHSRLLLRLRLPWPFVPFVLYARTAGAVLAVCGVCGVLYRCVSGRCLFLFYSIPRPPAPWIASGWIGADRVPGVPLPLCCRSCRIFFFFFSCWRAFLVGGNR